MEASTLNCPMCGAPAASDTTQCTHCQARLATVACPSCFGMLFVGAKFCPQCGAKAARVDEVAPEARSCPGCGTDLQAVALGDATLHECPECAGLWVDVETFQAICADREKQSVVLGGATPDPLTELPRATLEAVRYRPCPVCRTLMNRVNFSDRSGIIMDACRGHGTWLDRDELRRVVEFIRAGGVEASRDRDRRRWETEKRRQNTSGPVTIETPLNAGSMTRDPDLSDILYLIGRVILDFLKK